MKNYFEHDVRVEYIEGLLNHSQDWEWFVRYIEENYDLEDISSWDEYRSKNNYLSEVLSSFVKIIEISNTSIESHSKLLSDLINVAAFFIGRIDQRTCSDKVTTNFGHLLFFVVYITKNENSINGTNFITDYSLLMFKNYWTLIEIESIELTEEINHIARLNIHGWAEIEKVLRDNINKVPYDYSDDFFETFGNSLYSANVFRYQRLTANRYCTWEEQFLLDMTNTSIDDDKLVSAVIINDLEIPDQTRWTKERLDHMKSFFHHKQATFIIESVSYYLYGEIPSNEIVIDHFSLVNNLISENTWNDITEISSLKIISRLFKNRDIDELIRKDEAFIAFMKYIHSIQDPDVIRHVQDMGLPVSKEQTKVLRKAAENYFNDAQRINNLSDFSILLQNRPDIRYLTNNQLALINDAFVDLTEAEQNNVLIASVFYEYMCFLLEVNSKSLSIDKSRLHQFMINTQLLWELEFFEQQLSSMHSFNFEIPATPKDINQFNELALKSPITIANTISAAKCEELCNVMKIISENPLIHFVSHFAIGSSYPIKKGTLKYSRHEVDKLLYNHVQWIKQEKGYKFLNNLDEDKYVRGILEQYRERVDATATLLTDESGLYKKVENCCDIKLIEYNKELTLAHLAQLFPLLEMKIRDLARNEGYFPFKKQTDEFMQYNDPSSILREIITGSCKGLHGFDPVPDLYFIYNCMYNTNSLNIRNEVIHGRGFLSQSGLHYALRITLLCILMVEQRLEIIFYNRRQGLKNE